MTNRSTVVLTLGVAIMLLFGPSASAGLEFPFTTATQAEYASGDTAIILGYEYPAGMSLMVKITRPDGSVRDAQGRINKADLVTTDSFGQFSYEYPQLNQVGSYWVEIIDAATLGHGRNKLNGTVLATTVFKDNIVTDLELVGMPDALCGATRPPAHGSSPPTPSHGHDGLVDALAGKCLVGTTDVQATGNDNDVRGFYFDLEIDIESFHQGPGNTLLPFIDRLETVAIANMADSDVGSSQADDGTGGCVSNCYYTTLGNTLIPDDGTVLPWQSLDGTWFDVQLIGPGNMAGEDRYRITVSSDTAKNPSALLAARFEYCARINPNAGDGDLGTDGFITSDPVTGGTEASPINICRLEDQTPPICIVTPKDCGVDVFVHDPEGVQQIEVTMATNVNIIITPPNANPGLGDIVMYNPAETLPINVDVLKVVCDDFGWVEIEITNSAGLITVCDPVDFTLIPANGPPVLHEFALNDREGLLFLDNRGLHKIFMTMNGHQLVFSTTGATGVDRYSMPEHGSVTYDLTEFLVPGDNTVVIKAVGPPRGNARILLHD